MFRDGARSRHVVYLLHRPSFEIGNVAVAVCEHDEQLAVAAPPAQPNVWNLLRLLQDWF